MAALDEAVAGQRQDPGLLDEFLAGQRDDSILWDEILRGQRIDGADPVEWLAGQRQDPVVPVEWSAAVLFIADGLVPLEFRPWPGAIGHSAGSRCCAEPDRRPVELLATIRPDAGLTLDAASGQRGNVGIACEFAADMLSDGFFPAEFVIIARRDAAAPAELLAKALRDPAIQVEWSALPPPVRVSLERLLASPGRRRLLDTYGRVRVLKGL
jgi:hypothetical protein